MRKTLAIREGELLSDGRILQKGALHIGEDQNRVPITWANDNVNFRPIGWAHSIERSRYNKDDHTEVSFDMVMKDPDFELSMFEAYPYATNIEEEVWDTSTDPVTKLVSSARIRAIQLVPIQGHTLIT